MKESITKTEKDFLSILKSALNADIPCVLEEPVDWEKIGGLAYRHLIISLLAYTIYEKTNLKPSSELFDAWKRDSIGILSRNERMIQAQKDLLDLLGLHKIPCAILKGTSLSVLYNKMEYRPLGDIDLLVHEKQYQQAMEILESKGYHKRIDNHEFHKSFHKDGIDIEIHRAVSDFPDSAVGRSLKEWFQNATHRIAWQRINNYSFPILSNADQALALLLHMERHIYIGNMGLRQLCDWFVFINSVSADELHNDILPVTKTFGLYKFACIVTQTCVDFLGLNKEEHNWCAYISHNTTEELLVDILDGGSSNAERSERVASSKLIKRHSEKTALIPAYLNELNMMAENAFPLCKKVFIIKPVLFVYFPLRYLFRQVTGKNKKKSLSKTINYAKDRKKLLNKFEMFQTRDTLQ